MFRYNRAETVIAKMPVTLSMAFSVLLFSDRSCVYCARLPSYKLNYIWIFFLRDLILSLLSCLAQGLE